MGEFMAAGEPSILTSDHLGKVVAVYHADGTIMVRDQLRLVEQSMSEAELRNQDGNIFTDNRVIYTHITMRTVGGIRLDPSKGPYRVEVEQ